MSKTFANNPPPCGLSDIQSYAIAKNLTNENLAFYLLAILNAASTFGRVIPNLIADRIGPVRIPKRQKAPHFGFKTIANILPFTSSST